MYLWTFLPIVALAALVYYVLRPVIAVPSTELPPNFPKDTFSHQSFSHLLEKFGVNGRLDYERWHNDTGARRELQLYLGAIAAYSPDNAPERFREKAERTAYWMYAYNAFVISAILDRWPLKSVMDVKAPIEVVQGLGFFYKLKFVAGEQTLSLYEMEHEKVLKQAQDPRVHFVLNCGSGSCPTLRPQLPTGDDLEPYLAQAAANFVADEANVTLDHVGGKIILSRIFKWYKDDFENELVRRGISVTHGVLGYLPLIATGSLQRELERALEYKIEYREFNWSLNQAEK